MRKHLEDASKFRDELCSGRPDIEISFELTEHSFIVDVHQFEVGGVCQGRIKQYIPYIEVETAIVNPLVETMMKAVSALFWHRDCVCREEDDAGMGAGLGHRLVC